ncbi:MAG: amino acid adenylation domain-containing protein [Acidobacteria bacterium]|nr:amino acid adenylation domain-containing protein [Acidobacteriota bacterium]
MSTPELATITHLSQIAVSKSTSGEVPITRKQHLLSLVFELLNELSGTNIAGVDPSASFLELGFDSLMLTQASQLLQRKFKVPVTFRQLMEDLSTPSALADALDKRLPPGEWAPTHPASETSLDQTPHSQQTGEEKPAFDNIHSAALRTEKKSHGPFRPIETAVGETLTADQQQHLQGLIDRYTRRTAGSKRFAQSNRHRLADPRAVAGFKQIWKEIVYPIVVVRSEGSKVWDVDNNEYIDFVMGFGASLFGHRPAFVVKAVEEQLRFGFEIGPMTALAGEVADLITEFTGMERVSFCNTGSEAVMASIRLARTVTGRDRIAVFAGSYHGIFDEVLVRRVNSEGQRRSAPIAPGIVQGMVDNVLVLESGDPESLKVLQDQGHELACVLVEPVQSRRLDLQPKDFLSELRRITQQTGTALVFDEIVTGFRVHPGGAQKVFGVQADLATYGKVLGGGLPIGVVAGKARFMDALDGGMWHYGDASFPEVGVTFFAGTFVRHPLALAAARAVLLHLKEKGLQLQTGLNDRTARLASRLRSCLAEHRLPLQLTQFSSLMGLSLPPELRAAGLLFCHLREKGIHIWENRNFILTSAHTDEDLDRLVTAFDQSLQAMQTAGFLPNKVVETVPEFAVSSAALPEQMPDLPLESPVLALTPAQRELWLTSFLEDNASRALNNTLVIRMRGSLNVETMQRSLQALVDRHDSLRTRFDAKEPRQQVLRGVRLEIPVVDRQGFSEEEQQAWLADELAKERKHVFDLTQPPLMRIKIIKLGGSEHLLLLNFHHLVTDGWSIGVLLDELKKFYNSWSQREPVFLDPAMQFAEYLQTQEASSFRELERGAMSYWLTQFKDVPSPLDLPVDRSRPAIKTFRGAREMQWLTPELYRTLKKTSALHGTTVLALLLASFKVLVHRLTSQEDIVIGVPAAGQIAPDLQSCSGGRALVGHCVNFLPIRSQCRGEETFASYLKTLQRLILDAYEHQAFTFGSLVEKLKIPRDHSRFPIVSLAFNLDQAIVGFELSGLAVEVETLARDFVVFDLEMNLVDSGKDIRIECTYNRDLFDPETIKRWLGHWKTLLNGITRDPGREIARMEMLEEEERKRILVDWNDTQVSYPNDKTVHELFELQVQRTPGKPAVEFEGRQLTYSELNEKANQIARRLRALPARSGDLVGVCVERSIEMPAAILGVLKSGGAYVPLDPTYPRERLRFMLEDAAVRVVVGQSWAMDALPKSQVIRVCLDFEPDKLSKLNRENLETLASPEDLAHVIYTSGSTGKPKGVQIRHRAVANLLSSVRKFAGTTENDILLAVSTLSFDMAGLELFLPLITGAKVVVASRRAVTDGKQLAGLLDKSGATIMQATPATWRLLLEAGWKGSQNLKILCGGEEMPPGLARQLLERGATVWNVYGPTETTIYATMGEVRREDDWITIGRPIANTQIYILDAKLQPVPIGVGGELYIGGEGLARGYLGRPELTQERFVANPFSRSAGARLYRSGDLARYRADGRIEHLGRIDRQVKIRGFRIELGEIEAALREHAAVRQSVVMARQDGETEKRLVAYFTAGKKKLSSSELRRFLKGRLPGFMMPAVFVQLDKLPLNANGKIDRQALPAPEQVEPVADRDYCPPRDRLELQLTKMWESLLKTERVGIRDNFFEIGGHSLLAVRLLTQVNQSMRRNLPLVSVFQAPTVEKMAKLLREKGWTPPGQSLVVVQPSGSRPPFFCVHGYPGYPGLATHLGQDQPFYGLIQGLDGKKFHTRVEDLASHYLKDVKTISPRGPYFLGGHSFGGLVAFEMARQLKDRGEQVGLLVLMDSTPSSPVATTRFNRERSIRCNGLLSQIRRNFRQFSALSAADKRVYLEERKQRMVTLLSKSAKRLVCEGYLKFGYSLPPGLRTFYIDKILFGRYYPAAANNYVAQPCDLPAILIEAETNESAMWQQLIPHGLLIREMPAKHMDMLKEPHVSVLAGHLYDCLERVFRAKPAATA